MNYSYYDILGINKDASQDEIKKAYRKLASKYHPDVSTDPKANEKMALLNEAYDTLKDPMKRADYDQYGTNSYNSESNNDTGYTYYNYNPNSNYEYSGGYVYPKSAFSIGRLILTILFLGIVFTALYRLIVYGASLFKENNGSFINDFEYSYYTNNEVIMSHYYGSDTKVTIGETYNVFFNQYKVVGIGDEAFKNNRTIEEIVIYPSISIIGSNAFKGCRNLSTIYFMGTEEDYNMWIGSVNILSGNETFTSANVVFESSSNSHLD